MQTSAILFKFLLVIELVIEIALYIVELYLLNKFRSQRTQSKQKLVLSERSKRKKFGKKYALINAIWTGFCLFIMVIVIASVETQSCRSDQTASSISELVCDTCQVQNCASCHIAGVKKCDLCKPGFYMLEDS